MQFKSESFFKTGTTSAVLSTNDKTQVMKRDWIDLPIDVSQLMLIKKLTENS